MNWPPLLFRIRIFDKGKKIIGLWIPSLIILLILLPIIVLAYLMILIADLFTVFRFRMTLLFTGVLAVITHLTGTSIQIQNQKEDSRVIVDIK